MSKYKSLIIAIACCFIIIFVFFMSFQNTNIVEPLPESTVEAQITPTPRESVSGVITIKSTPLTAQINTPVPTKKPSNKLYGQNSQINPSVIGGQPKTVRVWSTVTDFNIFLGNQDLAQNLLTEFALKQRPSDIKGFFTWYYLPDQMNAFRTIYNGNNCFVALDAQYGRDKQKAMHFVLVEVTKPTPQPPFIAFVGDLGPLQQYTFAWTNKGQTYEVDYGGEPVVMDVPVGCFGSYINQDLGTAYGNIYVLNSEETLNYINTVMNQ